MSIQNLKRSNSNYFTFHELCLGRGVLVAGIETVTKPLRLVRDILDKGEQLSWGVGGEAEHIIAPR